MVLVKAFEKGILRLLIYSDRKGLFLVKIYAECLK